MDTEKRQRQPGLHDAPPEIRRTVSFQSLAAQNPHENELAKAPPEVRRAYQRTGQQLLDSGVLAYAEDPLAESDKLEATIHLSNLTGVDPATVYSNYETVARDYWGRDVDPPTALEAIQNSYQASTISTQINQLWYRIWGGEDTPEIRQRIAELEASMPPQDQVARSLPVRFIKDAAQLVGQQQFMVAAGLRLGTPAGIIGGALAAGAQGGVNVGPLQAVKTATRGGVRSGIIGAATLLFSTMFAAGSVEEAFRQQTGALYRDMIDSGVDPAIARAFAGIGGAGTSVIEHAQVTQLLSTVPGLDRVVTSALTKALTKHVAKGTVKNTALRLVGKQAVTATTEAVEEGAQEVMQMILTDAAKSVQENLHGTPMDTPDLREKLDQIWDVMATTWRGTFTLALPGHIAGEVFQARQNRTQTPRPMQAPETPDQPADTDVAEETPQRTVAELEGERQKLESAYETTVAQFEQDPGGNVAELLRVRDELETLESELELARAEEEEQAAAEAPKEPWQMTRTEYEAAQTEQVREQETAATQRLEQAIEAPEIRETIREHMPQLSEEEVVGAALLLDLRAQAAGVDTQTYLDRTFAPGLFSDPDTARSTVGEGNRGAVQFLEDGRAIFHATENSDFSTWTHELAHVFRRQLPAEDMAVAAAWAGASEGWTVEAEEEFARGFEKYLYDGQAPSPELQGIFERFAEWLRRIYTAVRDRWNVNQDIRSVYDRLLTDQDSGVVQSMPTALQQETAWHGSPHAFDRFTTEAIGTGEGAQAFGWGLYFSSSEGIARSYAQALAVGPQRNLYRVTLNPEREEGQDYRWLNWHEPVTEADLEAVPERHQAFIKRALQSIDQTPDDWTVEYDDLQEAWYPVGPDGIAYGQGYETYTEALVAIPDLIESQRQTGAQLYWELQAGFNSAKETSMFLRDAGFTGIRYKAGTLSGGQTDAVNYVVFDENAVTIEERILFQPAPPESTEAFRRWFGASAVATRSGKPKVVYHTSGRVGDFDSFDPDKSDLGIHFGDEEAAGDVAVRYTIKGEIVGNYAVGTFPVYLRIENPLRLKDTGSFLAGEIADQLVRKGIVDRETAREWKKDKRYEAEMADTAAAREAIQLAGYDGVVYRNEREGTGQSYIIFEPEQAKSVYNRGTWDPEDPRLLYQPDRAGDDHYEAVRQAVERGVYVPDDVLEEYADQDWASQEREYRAQLEGEAHDFDDLTEYIDYQRTFAIDEPNPATYYKAIWNRAQQNPVPPETDDTPSRTRGNRQFLESLTKENLKQYLSELAARDELSGLHNLIGAVAKGVRQGKPISDGAYKRVMDQIKDDPTYYRQVFAAATGDTDEIRTLEEEAAADPEADELEKLRERNRELRSRNKHLEKSLEAQRREAQTERTYLSHVERKIKELESEIADVESGKKQVTTAYREALVSARKEARLQAVQTRRDLREKLKGRKEARLYFEKMVKRIMDPPAKNIAWEFAEQIRAIQDGLDVRGRRRLDEINEMILRKMEHITDEELKRILQKELEKQSLRELTPEELEKIAEEIDRLRVAGKQQRDMELLEDEARQIRDVNGVVHELTGGEGIERIRDIGTRQTEKKLRTSAVNKFRFATLHMNRITDLLGETSKRLLHEEVNQLTDEKLNHIDRRMEQLKQVTEELEITPKELGRPFDSRFTVEEAVGIYIALQNPDSWLAVVYGNNIGEETAMRIQNTLPRRYKAYAQALMNLFGDEDFQRLNKVFIRDKNVSMVRVKNYFPMRRQEITYDALSSEIAGDLMNRASGVRAYTWRGFTHQRKKIAAEHQKPIRIHATAVAMEGINKHEHYANFARHIKHLQRVYSDPAVQTAMAQQYGPDAYDIVQRYINRIANPDGYRAYDMPVKVLNTIRNNLQVSALSWNLMSALKQIPGFLLYLQDAGPVHMLESLGQFSVNAKGFMDFVNQRDPQVKHRTMDPFFHDLGRMNKTAYQRLVQKIGQVGLKPLELVDKWAVAIGWRATYNKAIAEGKSEQDAAVAAREATLRTQPSGAEKDLADIYTHAALKPFLMFTTPLNQIWNMISHDMPREIAQKQWGALILDAAALSLTGLAMAWLDRRFAPPEEPEEWVLDATSQYIEGMPFIGGEAMSAIRGEWWAGRGVNVLPVVTTLSRAPRTLLDPEKETAQKVRAAVRLTEDAMRASGLPAVATKRLYRMFLDQDLEAHFDPWQIIGGGPEQ